MATAQWQHERSPRVYERPRSRDDPRYTASARATRQSINWGDLARSTRSYDTGISISIDELDELRRNASRAYWADTQGQFVADYIPNTYPGATFSDGSRQFRPRQRQVPFVPMCKTEVGVENMDSIRVDACISLNRANLQALPWYVESHTPVPMWVNKNGELVLEMLGPIELATGEHEIGNYRGHGSNHSRWVSDCAMCLNISRDELSHVDSRMLDVWLSAARLYDRGKAKLTMSIGPEPDYSPKVVDLGIHKLDGGKVRLLRNGSIIGETDYWDSVDTPEGLVLLLRKLGVHVRLTEEETAFDAET